MSPSHSPPKLKKRRGGGQKERKKENKAEKGVKSPIVQRYAILGTNISFLPKAEPTELSFLVCAGQVGSSGKKQHGSVDSP